MAIDPSIPLQVKQFSLSDIMRDQQAREESQFNREYRTFQMDQMRQKSALDQQKAAKEAEYEDTKDLAAAVRWADNPDRWKAAQAHYASEGKDYSHVPFEQRDSILLQLEGGLRAYQEGAPKGMEPTALERNYQFFNRTKPGLADLYLQNQANPPRMFVNPVTGEQMYMGTPAPQGGPTVGSVEEGYRFKGGNPADPNNWEPAGGAGSGPQNFP